MSVTADYNEAVALQAKELEEVLDYLWRSTDQPVVTLNSSVARLRTVALTLQELADAVQDGSDACETIRQLAGCDG